MSKQDTAVDWFYDKIKSHFEHDGDLLETLMFTASIAKEKEKQQHSETWDKAMKQLENRGYVYSRAFADFDDYYTETFNQ